MPNILRLIPRLDIKAPNLIKGVQLEGLRVVGDPYLFAKTYYEMGADELIYMDIVASLYERNTLHEIVQRTVRDVFIPVTVGGGLRNLEDVRSVLRAGADKVAVNTAAVKRPEFITEVAQNFGSQCMVLSIEAKSNGRGGWEAYTENGRERTGLDVIEWANKAELLGAGEILLTSVDREGTRRGFDCELVHAVTNSVSIPVIASGGMGNLQHIGDLMRDSDVSAIAIADALHFKRLSIPEIRTFCQQNSVDVRSI